MTKTGGRNRSRGIRLQLNDVRVTGRSFTQRAQLPQDVAAQVQRRRCHQHVAVCGQSQLGRFGHPLLSFIQFIVFKMEQAQIKRHGPARSLIGHRQLRQRLL
jgi:hypothetical protein